MSDIILSMRNGKPVVSSRQIAENFDKNHRDVLRAVDNLKEDVRNFAQMFFESTEAYYYKAVSVWLKSPGDESFKRNATCCILSAYFDTWVSKCVCLCRATSRDVPAFIVKKVGECWR